MEITELSMFELLRKLQLEGWTHAERPKSAKEHKHIGLPPEYIIGAHKIWFSVSRSKEVGRYYTMALLCAGRLKHEHIRKWS